MTDREPLPPEMVESILDASRGRWLTLTFRKRTDGSLRRMTCRVGVHRDLNGAGMKYDPRSRDLRVVWAADKLAYRMIPLDAVVEIVSAGLRTFVCPTCGCPTRTYTRDEPECLSCLRSGQYDADLPASEEVA